MPRPIWAGVFGMLRTTSRWSSRLVRTLQVAPATIETTSWLGRRRPPSSWPTLVRVCGLTDSRITSAWAAASRFDATMRTPYWRSSSSRRSGRGSLPTIWRGLHELAAEQPGDDRLGHDAGADGGDGSVRKRRHAGEYRRPLRPAKAGFARNCAPRRDWSGQSPAETAMDRREPVAVGGWTTGCAVSSCPGGGGVNRGGYSGLKLK